MAILSSIFGSAATPATMSSRGVATSSVPTSYASSIPSYSSASASATEYMRFANTITNISNRAVRIRDDLSSRFGPAITRAHETATGLYQYALLLMDKNPALRTFVYAFGFTAAVPTALFVASCAGLFAASGGLAAAIVGIVVVAFAAFAGMLLMVAYAGCALLAAFAVVAKNSGLVTWTEVGH
ncbi:hypothetical protein BJ742DRAFT_841514 [Cladochytrium replicatum]|nr:hypothetical protein BJ742DRAFT_841514 [Cladochytrium replicatum]